MKSAWQKEAMQELLTRLDQLTPDTRGHWGKMNCYQMLSHIADAVRMALGDLEAKPTKTPLRFAPVKKLIIYVLPFPKGAPTAPELIARTEGDWDKEVIAVKELLARFEDLQNKEDWPEHPAFGKLSKKDWGVLVYKHVDHHFRQFGV